MTRAALLALVVGLAGCERVPSFFGYWDIVEVEYAGTTQVDAGFFEIVNDGGAYVFARYKWDGSGFYADPSPEVVFGDTSQTAPAPGEGYAKKDETFSISMATFQAEFAVVEYTGTDAVLEAPAAIWPDSDAFQVGFPTGGYGSPEFPVPDAPPMTLIIQR